MGRREKNVLPNVRNGVGPRRMPENYGLMLKTARFFWLIAMFLTPEKIGVFILHKFIFLEILAIFLWNGVAHGERLTIKELCQK